MSDISYEVIWGTDAELALLSHRKFIDTKSAYKNAISILSKRPSEQMEGIVDYPDYEFNGYCWAKINNAIVLYLVDHETKKVFIDGCESAMTGVALKYFFKEHDPL